MAAIDEWAGVWRRRWIAWPDGSRDDRTAVTWVQGPSFFVDLRQPAGRPDFDGVDSLDACTSEHLAWLACQEGFAGQFDFDGTHHHWRRIFDFQSASPPPDVGALHGHGDHAIEIGRDAPYVEYWARDGKDPAPAAAVRFEDERGRAGFLVRTGDVFAVAIDRSSALPSDNTLAELLTTASAESIRPLLDCDISIGEIRGEAWIITASSLPFREGQDLAPQRVRDRLAFGAAASESRWRIVAEEASPADFALFSSANAGTSV
ncbi:hypothetical protein M2360_002920 [Rhizobium sp. SG_E_25_P2]|uniref:hypothetical protein n=1 Tax=Rhizobium sp. SG_E_25_P2 TaxID=2879942 RepID=UPI002474D92A|nr:hypothetical protein [Rhizobium sp. SG_E_25_P2]MDH6267523.1 hypothetical protein [Rhizobium sp. SG_E_25_P2]